MSTIEKAMRRLNGGAAVEGTSETLPSGADGLANHPPLVHDPFADEALGTNTFLEDPPAASEREASPAVRASAVRPARSDPEIPAATSVRRPAENPALQNRHPSSARRLLNVDFARLRQMGFLAPGDPTTRMAEEFQEIKRKLIANAQPGSDITQAPANLIMVTSSVPGEGKTFTSMNLALSLALEIDRTVLAVDIDILKSDLSRLFGAYNRTGLYDYLAHPELDLADIITRTNVPTLAFIPAGTIREGITERLASQAMFNLTRELAERYPDRLIIFDAPPVLATSGAAALAPLVGQVVLVVEAYNTTQENLRAALSALDHVPIAGIVLNKIRHRAVGRAYGANYGYGYGYGYGTTDPANPAAR